MFIDFPLDWTNYKKIKFWYQGKCLTYDEYLEIRKNIPDDEVEIGLTDMEMDVKSLQYLLDIFNGVDVRSSKSN